MIFLVLYYSTERVLEANNTSIAPPGRRLTGRSDTDGGGLPLAVPVSSRRRQPPIRKDEGTRHARPDDSPLPKDHTDTQIDGRSTSRGRIMERTAPRAGGRSHTPSYSGIEGIAIIIYLLIVILIYILDVDVTMRSPPKNSVPAYGSSRSTQGVLRGRAVGNTFNMGDVEAVWDDINKFDNHPDGESKKGKIYIYLSTQNPSSIDITCSDFAATVSDIARCQTIQDVMKLSSRNYSPIRSKDIISFSTIYE